MKNALVEKTYEISMKKFDFSVSKVGRLKKAIGRGKLAENRAILKKRGITGARRAGEGQCFHRRRAVYDVAQKEAAFCSGASSAETHAL